MSRSNEGCIALQRNRLPTLVSMLDGLVVSDALDIGCGGGQFLQFMKDHMKVRNPIGVDISRAAVRETRSRGLDAHLVDVSTSNLPFENDCLDLVFCSEVIEHVFDPDFLLGEIWRVLKNEGRVLVTTPNLACWHNRLVLLVGYQPHYTSASAIYDGVGKLLQKPVLHKTGQDETSHIRLFTLRSLEDMLRLHRFRIEITRGFTGTLPRAIRPIDSLFSKLPELASGLAVRAVKEYS